MNKFMQDPLFLMGAGILSQQGQPGQIGRGMMSGLNMYNQMQGGAQERALNELRMKQLQGQMAQSQAQRAAQQQLMEGVDPNIRQAMSAYPSLAQQYFSNQMMPQQPKPTDDIREYNFAKEQGYKGSFLDYQTDIREAGRTSLAVTVGGKGEQKYVEKRQEQQAQQMADLQKKAGGAYRQNQKLDNFIKSAGKGYAGSLAPIRSSLGNFFASFGFGTEALRDTTAMQQTVASMKADYMQELGARGLTDKDMEILDAALPRIETDPAARLQVANVLRKYNTNLIDEYDLALQSEKETYPNLKITQPPWLKMYRNRKQPTQGNVVNWEDM
jgi:ribosomal 50S subunit-associated protein YjgA (DUF615 family)